MNELAWSDGTKPERSQKENKPENGEENKPENGQENKNTQGIMNFKLGVSKREDVNNKMSERELVGKSCYNPFLVGTSYIDDLTIQDNFLIPRSSHENKV